MLEWIAFFQFQFPAEFQIHEMFQSGLRSDSDALAQVCTLAEVGSARYASLYDALLHERIPTEPAQQRQHQEPPERCSTSFTVQGVHEGHLSPQYDTECRHTETEKDSRLRLRGVPALDPGAEDVCSHRGVSTRDEVRVFKIYIGPVVTFLSSVAVERLLALSERERRDRVYWKSVF